MLSEMAEYLAQCPELLGRQICINYLAEDEGAVSLEVSGSRDTVREYADGGRVRGISFALFIRDSFGISQENNCRTDKMCEQIEHWVEEQNLKGNLPQLEGGARSVSVGIAKCFEVAGTKGFLAKYKAEIELIYLSPAN